MKLTNDILNSTPYQYACDVRDGKIVTGEKIKLAVKRFFTWIKNADDKGYYLDHDAGMHLILFAEKFIRHTKGPIAGQLFELSPYQAFTLYNIGAWKDQNGSRRIKTVYEKVARKNGKTAMLALLGLYFLTFDDEQSPEIYAAATKEAQAKIVWEQSYDMVIKSPELRSIGVVNTQREIRFPAMLGKFRFLGGDSKTQDGLNPSLAIIDELHAFKDDSVREVLESAMGARKNPLLYIITTAGFNKDSVCKKYEDVCVDILYNRKQDDHTFIMIHDLDNEDDWEDPANWIKANPNLNVSVSLDYLKAEYTKAVNQPSKIPNFKTKHLNMWVDAAEVRVSESVWKQNGDKIKLENFLKYGCAGALDLSSTTDLSALVFVSNPDEQGISDILPLIFCPLDTIQKRSKEDRVPYNAWKDVSLMDYCDASNFEDHNNYLANQSILDATPGNQIDYDHIQETIVFLNTLLNPKWFEYDPWMAVHIVQNMSKIGVEMNPFPQTITHFSAPTKEFEKRLYSGQFRHGNHPILGWMLSGVVAKEDPNENIRYAKNVSTKRIDGIVATVMALAGTMTEKETNESNYNNLNPDEITF